MELAKRVYGGRLGSRITRDQGLGTSKWERHLADLFDSTGRRPKAKEGIGAWMLWEWRRISLPKWRHILEESLWKGNRLREEYARWMLREILFDPEYESEEPQRTD